MHLHSLSLVLPLLFFYLGLYASIDIPNILSSDNN